MAALQFVLPELFEGPMDLLLHLISKHKLNLYDINILELVDQYTAYIDRAQEMDLSLTGDFIEMASRLVYMKTVMLLPKHEDEQAKLKEELQGQLIEYQICRQIAAHLREKCDLYAHFVRDPQPAPVDMLYRRQHQGDELLAALAALKGKLLRRQAPPKTHFTGIVAKRVVSVSSRIVFVLRRLTKFARVKFDKLFSKENEKTENVATFLALLELMKAKRVRVDDSGEITLQKKQKSS